MFGFQTLGALILLTPDCLIGWNIEQNLNLAIQRIAFVVVTFTGIPSVAKRR